MSNSDSNKILFSQYHSDQIISYFQVDPDNHAAIEAMRYKFRAVKDSYARSLGVKASFNKIISEEAIEAVEFRYDLLKNYGESFFPRKYKPDMDGLTIAVICDSSLDDSYTEEAPDDYEGDDFDGVLSSEHFSNLDSLRNAISILEGVIYMESQGIPEEKPPLLLEMSFVFHVNLFERLREMERNIDAIDKDELRDFLIIDLPPARTVVFRTNPMGRELADRLDQMEAHIEAILDPPPRGKPQLRLVPSPSRD